jgi:menaquinone-dependent protoporphyrinogen oxidase
VTQQRTLVAYATKGGVTGENALIITEVLRTDYEHQVDLVNLKERKVADLSPYDTVVIGTGIRIGRWYGPSRRLFKNRGLADKRVVVFLSSGEAGEDAEKATAKYSEKICSKYEHLKPFEFAAFGGRMPGNEKMDFTDPEKVREWAHELGEKLK